MFILNIKNKGKSLLCFIENFLAYLHVGPREDFGTLNAAFCVATTEYILIRNFLSGL